MLDNSPMSNRNLMTIDDQNLTGTEEEFIYHEFESKVFTTIIVTLKLYGLIIEITII